MSPLMYSWAPDSFALPMSEPPEPPHMAMRETGTFTGAEHFRTLSEKRSFTKAIASSADIGAGRFPIYYF